MTTRVKITYFFLTLLFTAILASELVTWSPVSHLTHGSEEYSITFRTPNISLVNVSFMH